MLKQLGRVWWYRIFCHVSLPWRFTQLWERSHYFEHGFSSSRCSDAMMRCVPWHRLTPSRSIIPTTNLGASHCGMCWGYVQTLWWL